MRDYQHSYPLSRFLLVHRQGFARYASILVTKKKRNDSDVLLGVVPLH